MTSIATSELPSDSRPAIGPVLATSSTVLSLEIFDPPCEITAYLFDPVRIEFGPSSVPAGVRMRMSGDVLDAYWCGDYDLLDGMARGEIEVSGPVSRVL